MSDHWEQFPCMMGDYQAFISYDHGVRDELGSLPFPNFASFRINLLAPDERGLPQGDEFTKLNEIEDFLCAQFPSAKGVHVGRVTARSRRYFYFYTLLDEPSCQVLTENVEGLYGHSTALLYEQDLERSHYWKELFPTEDDWQVIRDIRVQDALQRHGDSLLIPRSIDHWVYFKEEVNRQTFLDRVKHEFEKIEIYDGTGTKKESLVARLSHHGLPDYRSINSKTLLLSRVAREVGGEYDGWESPVCRT